MSGPGILGWQPPHRYAKTNRYRFHAFGCSADGGPGLRPGICLKCQGDSADDIEVVILIELDKYAGSAR